MYHYSLWLKYTIILIVSLTVLPAETEIIWDKRKVVNAVNYQEFDRLEVFIKIGTKSQLNEPLAVGYYGNASFLGLLMHFIQDKAKAKLLVKQLLDKGVNLEGIENDSFTPIKQIFQSNKTEFLGLFLDAGLSPNMMVEGRYIGKKMTLLHFVLDEYPSFMEKFVSYSPKVVYPKETLLEYGYLSLYLKRSQGLSVKVVKYFLDNGEKADDAQGAHYTPYQWFLKSVSIFDSKVDPEAYQRRLEVFNLLLDSGIDPLVKGGRQECMSPLAIVRGDRATLNRLFEKGLKATQKGCYGKSHFEESIHINDLNLFKVFLEKGADLFKKNHHGKMVLSQIVEENTGFLEWIFAHKKEVFDNLSEEEKAEMFLNIVRHKKDGAFKNLRLFLLEGIRNKKELSHKALQMAIAKSKLTTAKELLSMNNVALPLKSSQSKLWNPKLKTEMIDWLLDNKVSPFDENNSCTDVLKLEAFSISQLDKLIRLYPKTEDKKILLDEIFIAIVSNLRKLDHFLVAEKKLRLLEKHGLEIKKVSELGKSYLPRYVRSLIGDNREENILWLLIQGVRITAENQEHYVDSNYMRRLIDQAGEGVVSLNFVPKNEQEEKELEKEILRNVERNDWYQYHKNKFKAQKVLVISENNLSKSDNITTSLLHFIEKYELGEVDPKRYVLWSLIILFYFLLMLTFIMLIRYFMQMRKEVSTKEVVPSLKLMFPFILVSLWIAVFVLNNMVDIYYFGQYLKGTIESTAIKSRFIDRGQWYLIYLFLLILELVVVVKLFQLSFIQKTYQLVTFYSVLFFFVFSLLFLFMPTLIVMIDKF